MLLELSRIDGVLFPSNRKQIRVAGVSCFFCRASLSSMASISKIDTMCTYCKQAMGCDATTRMFTFNHIIVRIFVLMRQNKCIF